jgi:hypothetical protein
LVQDEADAKVCRGRAAAPAWSEKSPKAKSMFQRGLEIEPGNQKLRDALMSLQ